jgi:translation initiation factor IF-1
MGKAAKVVLAGVVEVVSPDLSCAIRLDSGEQVQARIPRHTARLILRVVPGDRVAVESRGAGPFAVLGHERVVLDKLIVAHLTQDKRSVSDWFLIGDCVCFWSRHGDIGEWLTSDNRLSSLVRDYLRRIGAPVYESGSEARRVRPEPRATADGPSTPL